MLVTPLQLANAYAALANGGIVLAADDRAPDPRTRVGRGRRDRRAPGERTHRASARDPPAHPRRAHRRDHPGRRHGAEPFRGFPEGFTVAGKTGTAQVSGGRADTSLFVGFGPVDVSQYVVTAILEESGFGGQAAAPLVRRVFEALADPSLLPQIPERHPGRPDPARSRVGVPTDGHRHPTAAGEPHPVDHPAADRQPAPQPGGAVAPPRRRAARRDRRHRRPRGAHGLRRHPGPGRRRTGRHVLPQAPGHLPRGRAGGDGGHRPDRLPPLLRPGAGDLRRQRHPARPRAVAAGLGTQGDPGLVRAGRLPAPAVRVRQARSHRRAGCAHVAVPVGGRCPPAPAVPRRRRVAPGADHAPARPGDRAGDGRHRGGHPRRRGAPDSASSGRSPCSGVSPRWPCCSRACSRTISGPG